jgi:hypothetical protein
MRRVLISGVVALVSAVLLAGSARATVFSWRDEGGTYHFTNRPDEVPEGPLDAFRTSTEAPPPQASAADCAGDPPVAADPPAATYEQGVEAGLRLGAEQIRIAGEIAQQAQPEPVAAPPQVIYVQQPAPVVEVVPYDAGCGGRGCGYGYGYWYPFNSWVVTSPGFFPRRSFGHGRFAGGHHLGGRSFPGGAGVGLHGGHGMHGAGFWGRR